jgi:transcriptional regulator of acetoin/glycerol metabolism
VEFEGKLAVITAAALGARRRPIQRARARAGAVGTPTAGTVAGAAQQLRSGGQQMTSTPSGPLIPRTAVEWERVRAVKLDVLARDPMWVDPADHPGVRPEVVASWRRSMLAGVDPGDTAYHLDPEFQPRTRLAAVAQPIMDRMRDEISDLSSWGFLADRGCRLLTTVVGDFPRAARVHLQNLCPGMSFAEDVMGTNGLGCAHETQQAFLISGSEHFRTDTEIITTTGVIIRDPFTRRHVGSLGVHCFREYGSAALLPLVVEIGRSIEAQLLASRSDGDRELFDAYSAAERRYRSPVVAVSSRLCVLSTHARTLVREADEEALRRIAAESGTRGRVLRRTFSSGAAVTVRAIPVRQPRGEFAAVLVLHPVAGPGRAAPESGSSSAHDFRDQLTRALGRGRPVLMTGERGSGKRHHARAALRALGHRDGIAELDATVARIDPAEWLRGLAAALRDERAAVLLGHVTDVPAELMGTVAQLLSGAACAVVGTASQDSTGDGCGALLRESFPVLVTVPPLRERRAEFAGLCAELLAELGEPGTAAVTLTPRAAAALAACEWPGNLRQLVQVLASALVRARGPTLDLPDLPALPGHDRAGHPLDEVLAAERRVLMSALRDAGGDRNLVADRLGISRATVYRKLKRHQLR